MSRILEFFFTQLKFEKTVMIKNCDVCDGKYITTYIKTTTNDSLLSYKPSLLYSFVRLCNCSLLSVKSVIFVCLRQNVNIAQRLL